jgi:hypothetical protein
VGRPFCGLQIVFKLLLLVGIVAPFQLRTIRIIPRLAVAGLLSA